MARKNTTRTGEQTNGRGSEMGVSNGVASQEQSELIGTEEIAARAYGIYEREGRADGQDMEHWLRAESELRSERNRGSSVQQNLPRSARLQQNQQRVADGVGGSNSAAN